MVLDVESVQNQEREDLKRSRDVRCADGDEYGLEIKVQLLLQI